MIYKRYHNISKIWYFFDDTIPYDI